MTTNDNQVWWGWWCDWILRAISTWTSSPNLRKWRLDKNQGLLQRHLIKTSRSSGDTEKKASVCSGELIPGVTWSGHRIWSFLSGLYFACTSVFLASHPDSRDSEYCLTSVRTGRWRRRRNWWRSAKFNIPQTTIWCFFCLFVCFIFVNDKQVITTSHFLLIDSHQNYVIWLDNVTLL